MDSILDDANSIIKRSNIHKLVQKQMDVETLREIIREFWGIDKEK
jgi:hypothetical protein